MRRVSENERKEISIEILSEIDYLCRKHGITYYLGYGTLLGAVRHKGFIPWDDDVDIWVPIEQYNSLYSVLMSESKYIVNDCFKDVDWFWAFSKLYDGRTYDVDNDNNTNNMVGKRRGQAVDIFPLFRIDDEKKKVDMVFKCHTMIKRMFNYRNGLFKGRILPQIFCKMNGIFGYDDFYYKNKLYELELADETSTHVGCPFSPYGKKDFHLIEDFEVIELEYEGKMFYAPRGYDRILTNLYGEYMELPPVEKRISVHNYVTYWAD